MSYEQIITDIKNRKFAPVYLLMGDESYFIDKITEELLQTVVATDLRDFNQTVFYGLESNVYDVINAARRFPMMSDQQIVVVKEAQKLSKIEELAHYVSTPLKSTVLVIAHKYGTVDKRKKFHDKVAAIGGVVFESKKIQDYKLPAFISSFVQTKALTIDGKAAQMLADYLGNDLSKLSNELDKLTVSLAHNTNKRITPELIETNIGISKDFNVFELQKAVISKDVYKAMQIADYFDQNPKENPLVVTLGALFTFFSNLMICYWAKDKSENGLAAELGFRASFMAKDYVQGVRNYNPWKSMEIISLIRTYDAKHKGIDSPSISPGILLKELLYKIMH